jgi:hypothetical protein
MKRIDLTIPDEAYYEYQKKAGGQRRDTDDLIEEVLIRESGVDRGDMVLPDESESFRNFILQWDWPNGKINEGTVGADHVVSVVKRMNGGLTLPEAINKTAEESYEEDPTLGDRYNLTVRGYCTNKHRGVTAGADQFRAEVRDLLHKYEQGK